MQSNASTTKQNEHDEGNNSFGHYFVSRERNDHAAKQKVQVFVRSERVLVSDVTSAYPSFVPSALSPLSPMVRERKRLLTYENQLNPVHQKVVEEATTLAERFGFPVEVRDLAKLNLLGKIAMYFRTGGISAPAVVFPGSSLSKIRHSVLWQSDAVSTSEQTAVGSESPSLETCSCTA